MKDKIDGQEDFTLKKIRYYQGTIADFDTFWKQKAEQGIKEESPETKACKDHNDNLNKAFEIVPVSKDDDQPKPLTPGEVKQEEEKEKKEKESKKEEKKDDKDKKSKKDDEKDDDKKKSKKDKEVNESFLNVFKLNKSITEVQEACEEEINNLLKTESDKYKSGKDILDKIKDSAIKLYNKKVSQKFDNAIDAKEWWGIFSETYEKLLNTTLFKI